MTLGALEIQAPALLAGLLAAAIPVLLHLLAKVRAPQVLFPTLRFLRLSMDKTARRRRVQHWLLMLLRMAALALLAIAVSQPLVRAASGRLGSDRDTAAVLILDNSLSMQAPGRAASRLDSARAAALELLNARGFQRVALIVTNGPLARTPPTELTDRADAIDLLPQVGPGCGSADLAAAIARAEELLANSNLPNQEVYLFSDLQVGSARTLRNRRASHRPSRSPPPLLVVTPMPLPKPSADKEAAAETGPVNLAVSEIVLDQPSLIAGQPIHIMATVRNYSRLAQKAQVCFFLDETEQPHLQEQTVDLAGWPDPGATQTVSRAATFASPGRHWITAQVRRINQAGVPDTDDLPADDRFSLALHLAERVHVLLVKQRHDLDASSDAGYMLRQLMTVATPDQPARPFELEEILAADGLSAERLARQQVVITSDVAEFVARPPGADAAAATGPAEQADPIALLRDFVTRGGTWMIWLGPHADPAAYNKLLAEPAGDEQPAILPWAIDRYVGTAAGGRQTDQQPIWIKWVDVQHPMFQGVYPTIRPYQRVLIHRYAALAARQGSSGKVIARLNTGEPLVVESRIGKGRVLLFATAANPRWTSWLGQGPAMAIYQMLLAGGSDPRARPAGPFKENDQVGIDLGASAKPPGFRIVLPDDTSLRPAPRGMGPAGANTTHWRVEFAQTDQLGVYAWEAVAEQPDGPAPPARSGAFAVNVPADESDLTPVSAKEFSDLLSDRQVLVRDSVSELQTEIDRLRQGAPLWPYILAAVLVVLAVEAKIANRSRPTGTAGLKPVLGAPGPEIEASPPPAGQAASAGPPAMTG